MTDVPEKYKNIPGAYPLTIAGREMWFKPPGQGQIVLFERIRMQIIGVARMNDDENSIHASITILAKALNIIDSLFLDPDDRDYVEMLLTQEKITIPEITPILSGGKQNTVSDDDEEPEVKKTARRANPSRAKR